MFPSLSIRHKVLLGFGLAILAVAVIATLSLQSTRSFINTAEWVSHTHRVLETHEALLRHLMEAESAARGYLITGDGLILDFFEQAAAEGLKSAGDLRQMVAEDPEQLARLKTIRKRMDRKLAALRDLIELRRAEGDAAALKKFSAMGQEGSMLEIRALMAEFKLEE